MTMKPFTHFWFLRTEVTNNNHHGLVSYQIHQLYERLFELNLLHMLKVMINLLKMKGIHGATDMRLLP